MWEQTVNSIELITNTIIAALGRRDRGSPRRFPWTLKHWQLGPGRIRTIVRLLGTRVFLLRRCTTGRFTLIAWMWQVRRGWVRVGTLFFQRNGEGGFQISDVRVSSRTRGMELS
jgi:hypothetical protein